METPTAGSAPVTAPNAEPKVITTEAAPAAAPSSLTAQQDFEKSVREARTPAELRAATERMRNLSKPELNAESKEAAAAKDGVKPAEAPKADETPVAEETPAEPAAEEPTAEADAPAEDAETAESDDDAGPDEGDIAPSTAKKLRLRLPEDDQVGRLATAYMQRNRDWTMDQALAAAKNKLGIKPEAEKPAAAEAPKPNADLPQTVEAVDSATDRLEEEITKATTEMRFEDSDKMQRQLRRLDRHRANLVREGEQQQVQEVARYNDAFAKSEDRAIELYAFTSDKKSPGYARMMEIEASMKATKDPTFHDPNKPLIIAQMVGRELKIAPRSKAPAPAKAAAPVTPAAPAQKKGILPSGGSRTTPAATATPSGDTARFEGIKTMGELRKTMKELGIAG